MRSTERASRRALCALRAPRLCTTLRRMGISNLFSGSSQRKTAIAQANQQQAEIAQQKELADTQTAASLQDILERDTNRLMRIFGTRSLIGAPRLAA
jgi:hypothetical protein